MKSRSGIPRYRVHKPSGRAVVTLNGRDIYVGVYGSKVSRLEYDRLVAEWLAHDRRLPGQVGGGDGIMGLELKFKTASTAQALRLNEMPESNVHAVLLRLADWRVGET